MVEAWALWRGLNRTAKPHSGACHSSLVLRDGCSSCQRGLRFSRNAARPSRKSAVARTTVLAWMASSNSRSSSRSESCTSNRLVCRRAVGLRPASSAASSRARSNSFPPETISVTSPSAWASAAGMIRPERSKSRARWKIRFHGVPLRLRRSFEGRSHCVFQDD